VCAPEGGGGVTGRPAAIEVGIVSADAAALVDFYRAAFAMAVTDELSFPQGTVHKLRRDEARVKVFQPADGAAVVPPREPWHRDTGYAYAAFHTDDVDGLYERVQDHGGSGLVAPTSHRPGARFALVRDPQGNTWELLSEP
jgi:predicted enzyme related to lactoylglutathione lyase